MVRTVSSRSDRSSTSDAASPRPSTHAKNAHSLNSTVSKRTATQCGASKPGTATSSSSRPEPRTRSNVTPLGGELALPEPTSATSGARKQSTKPSGSTYPTCSAPPDGQHRHGHPGRPHHPARLGHPLRPPAPRHRPARHGRSRLHRGQHRPCRDSPRPARPASGDLAGRPSISRGPGGAGSRDRVVNRAVPGRRSTPMNSVNLTGRLIHDPSPRDTRRGVVASFRLAVDARPRVWIDVEAWGHLAGDAAETSCRAVT
jgi:hypothetical protein